jgi:hypothetical protein
MITDSFCEINILGVLTSAHILHLQNVPKIRERRICEWLQYFVIIGELHMTKDQPPPPTQINDTPNYQDAGYLIHRFSAHGGSLFTLLPCLIVWINVSIILYGWHTELKRLSAIFHRGCECSTCNSLRRNCALHTQAYLFNVTTATISTVPEWKLS